MIGTIIELRGIEKSFYGVTVFKNFDLDFKRGEIHCICGENGAGKSTLIKILAGVYHPEKGEIYYGGKLVDIKTPHTAIGLGIQTIYQEHTLYPDLTVMENLFAGREYLKNDFIIDKKNMMKKTLEMLDYLEIPISPLDIVGQLGDGTQKLMEIARGLLSKSEVIILDEPTSSLGSNEIAHLLKVVRTLRDDGMCIIYISHHLEEVFEIADRATVIRDGEKIRTYEKTSLSPEKLISDMVGRDVSNFYQRRPVDIGDVMFEVKNLSGNGLNEISFSVHKGEIVGFSGMVGAGKTELAELLFGAVPQESGEILIYGNSVEIASPKQAIANHMCFITENRQKTGLFLEQTITANCVIAEYRKRKGFIIRSKDDVSLAQNFVKKLHIITTSIAKIVKELSGGNQQKVVLAKWFATQGDIFIFDEPTKGIDIGAKEEIYHLMLNIVGEGKCIILVSSDMPELIAMSDRILVMRDHKMVTELRGADINETTILKYSIGGVI
jgi:ribose transport system ATP-binding protein